jgi:hypothetical protein
MFQVLIFAWGFGVGDTVYCTPIRTAINLIPKTGLLYVNRYTKLGRGGGGGKVGKATPNGLDGQALETP